jgi:hypothetical protein
MKNIRETLQWRAIVEDYQSADVGIGDLVRIKSDIANPEEAGDVFGVLGIVIGTAGIRCKVQWATGDRTLPERQVLEVIV